MGKGIKVIREKILEGLGKIPATLKEIDKWCVFKNDKSGELLKKPISLRTGKGGVRSGDTDKLSSYQAVSEKINEGSYVAAGIVLDKDDGIVCIDLDCKSSKVKMVYEEIRSILLAKIPSYAETSTSGHGTHIFIKAKLSDRFKTRSLDGVIELFDSRAVLITGDIIKGRETEVIECQEALDWLCENYIPKTNQNSAALIEENIYEKTDKEVIDKLLALEKGQLLWSGNWKDVMAVDSNGVSYQRYPSKSEADSGLINALLYYNGNNRLQAKKLFLESDMGVFDNKKSSSYLDSQLNFCVLTLREVFNWNSNAQSTHNPADPEQLSNMDLKIAEKELLQRVKEHGLYVTNNPKLNKHVTKYVLLNGVAVRENTIDKQLLDMDSGGNGRRFYLHMQNDLIYNHDSKEWAIWNGRQWLRCYSDDLIGYTELVFNNLKAEAYAMIMQAYNELDEFKKERLEIKALELFDYASTRKTKRNCMEMIEFSKAHFPKDRAKYLEHNYNVLNLQNGVFDFERMQLMEHWPQYYQTQISDITYSPTAEAPIWRNMLERLLPDKEIRDYYQRAMGYTISAKHNEKALFFMVGEGNNGKTTTINQIHKIMGTYAVTVNADTIMDTNMKSNGARPDLHQLRGTRFAAVSESNEYDKLNEAMIKMMTGSSHISCRTLHKEPIEFVARFILWFDTNYKPAVRGTDIAIWSRIKVIPFEAKLTAEEMDRELDDKLSQELSGILNWCIEGYQMYCEQGLNEPESVKLVMKEYENDMSALDSWWKECIEVKTNDNISYTSGVTATSKELYQSYKSWCEFNGEYFWTQRKFTQEINKKAEAKHYKTVKGYRRYDGFYLNEIGGLCLSKNALSIGEFTKQYNILVRAELSANESTPDNSNAKLGEDNNVLYFGGVHPNAQNTQLQSNS